jgi:hypothetical protein
MNEEIRHFLISMPWTPRAYHIADLQEQLEIEPMTALSYALMINGVPYDHVGRLPMVLHHDLVEFLKDLNTIAPIPDSPEQIPRGGHWLIEHGWVIDTDYVRFRYVDPECPLLRYTMRSALKIEIERQNPHEELPSQEQDAIDVEYSVVSS